MKQIAVKTSTGVEVISAGAETYEELVGYKPIDNSYNGVSLIGSEVEEEDGNLIIKPSTNHRWTDEELRIFCDLAEDGRYDILTEDQGREMLLLDTITIGSVTTKRKRRISAQYDRVWNDATNTWVVISDTSAGSLIFTWAEQPPSTITYGTPLKLRFNYYSATGKVGVIKFYNNDTLYSTISCTSSSVPYEIDVTNFLVVGSNGLQLGVEVAGQTSPSPLYQSLNVVNLVLTSPFDENRLVEGESFNFKYTLRGSVAKTVHFKYDDDDEPFYQINHGTGTVEGADATLSTTGLSHGTHKLTVWATADIGGNIISTPELIYTIPIWKEDEEGAIVVINSAPTSLGEGDTINIEYTPYNRTRNSVDITLAFPEEWDDYNNIDLTVPINVKRSWNFVATHLGQYSFAIRSDGAAAIHNIEIVEGSSIQYESNGRLYMLDVVGRDNVSPSRNIINYNTISPVSSAVAVMENFNFEEDGWLTDKDENDKPMLRINSTARVTYPGMNLFKLLSNPQYGATLDVDFKSRNVSTSNELLISLRTSNDNGIKIYENKVAVNLGGTNYEVEYKAGERIRIIVAIEPNTSSGRLVKIYINGILSYVGTYISTIDFRSYDTDLVLNNGNGFVDIYGVRLYNTALNASQVLNNYIASLNDSISKGMVTSKSDIYDENGAILYSKVRDSIPTVLFTIHSGSPSTAQNLPLAKGDKKYCSMYYNDPLNPEFNFEDTYLADKKKPVLDVQGTSSQKYPRKNFKVKTNKGCRISNEVVNEKVFTFKKDFMDSSHANNTGLAKLAHRTYYTPVPPQMSYLEVSYEDGGETKWEKVYDTQDILVDFAYIYRVSQSTTQPFEAINGMTFTPKILQEDDKWFLQYRRINGVVDVDVCEIKTNKALTGVRIVDMSYVRTTVYGAPCAFFYNTADEPSVYHYQGIYNFNTDKVSDNNMKLKEDGVISFEFLNNVSEGTLFRSVSSFTEVRNSFELRAHKDLGLWEDYYDDDLEKWANGGNDDGDEIPILNCLYGTDAEGVEKQLYIGDTPINYPYVHNNLGDKFPEDPEVMEVTYSLTEDKLQVAHVATRANSDAFNLKDTISNIELPLGELDYYSWRNCKESPMTGVDNPLSVRLINQESDVLVQWGYGAEDSNVETWFNLCFISDVLTTISESVRDLITVQDVDVFIKSGTSSTIQWNYSYPVEQEWYDLCDVEDLRDPQGHPFTPISLRKYDLFEEMYRPVKDSVQWVIDCYNEHLATGNYNKFKNEFNEHLNMEYTTIYYVMCLFGGMADSLAKNMFWNSYDNGQTWYPVFYDIDTVFGLSNDGHPNFPYSLEIYGPGSTLGSADIYNGAKSNLWKLFAGAFPDEIRTMYLKLRNEKLTYESVMDVLYGEQISKIPIVHYNEDAKFNYLPYPPYYYTAQGSRYERLKWWIENRFFYLDSKFRTTNFIEDDLTLRMNPVDPIDITPDIDMFVTMRFGAHGNFNVQRCLANETVTVQYVGPPAQDLETAFFGASHIKSLGDLSNHQVTSMIAPVKTALVLQEIILGRDEEGYSNPNLTELTAGNNKRLKLVNVTNCTNLGTRGQSSLDLSQCPAIQYVYAKNTKLSTISLPLGSPLKEIVYPATVTNIELKQQSQLSNLTIQGYDNLTSITIVGSPKLNMLEELKSVYTHASKIAYVEFDNLNGDLEHSVTQDFMDYFMDLSDSKLEGTIYVQALDDAELNKYRDKWPNLNVGFHQIYADNVILGVENEGSSTVLERTYGAIDKDAQYADDNGDTVISDFDQLEPYTSMQIVVDNTVTPLFIEVDGYKAFNEAGYKEALSSEGNKFIRIPKFYTKYLTDSDGQVIGREISKYKVDNDYKYNPEFLRADGSERDYVDIGIYYSSNNIDSIAGVEPAKKTRFEWSNAIRNKFGEDTDFIYSTETIWTRQLLQDLFTVEFATTDSRELFKGIPRVDSGTTVRTGTTDVLDTYLTGYQKDGTNTQVPFKYRGLENIWAAGGPVHIHGIQFLNNQAFVSIDPEKYGTTEEDLISTNLRIPNTSGVVDKLKLDKIDNNIQLTLQSVIHPYGAYKDLVFGAAGTGTRYAVVASAVDPYGLWFLNGDADGNLEAMARLVRRPK